MLQNGYGNVTRKRIPTALTFIAACVAVLILALSDSAVCQSAPVDGIVKTPAADAPLVVQTPAEQFKRWFEIDALKFSPRYRLIRDATGTTVGNAAQYQFIGQGHFKFDKKGKYSIHFGVFTGNSMTGGWNNTGVGTGDGQTGLYLKQLNFRAKPVDGLEIQFGGLGLNNGVGTETTGYDVDAYLMGERVSVRLPKKVYFDEISVTNGFFGDRLEPNVLNRFKRLDEMNYHQFLVRKQLNEHISFSADYTFESGRDFLRQAVNFKVRESHILDTILFENYQRLDPDPGYGFNIFGDKAVHKNLVLGGGFARIDKPMFNADRFPPGNRLYTSMNWQLSREFSINSVLIQGIGDLPTPGSTRTRLDLSLTFNVLELLHRYKLH